MQRSTGKELSLRANEIRQLWKETLDHHKHSQAARASVDHGQALAMFHGWQAGVRLNKIKTVVGHGNWLSWLKANVQFSEDTAQIYMRIDHENPELRDVKKPNTEHVRHLKFDTIRRYKLGFAPDKDKPQHQGDIKLPRSVTFLNIMNEYNRVKQRHVDGLQLVDFEEVREEIASSDICELLQWVRTAEDYSLGNPWTEPPPGR